MEKRNTMIRDLAEDDKPREKALTKGIDSLSDTELLAIIFGSGLRGKSVIEMLKNAGCLKGMTQSNQMSLFV